MTQKLDKIVARYEFLTEEISKPEVIANNSQWKKLVKEHSNLRPIVECYEQYKKAKSELEANLELAEMETDKEMLALLHEDINFQKKQIEELNDQLKVLLLPKDPNDDKNVIMEIRGGAGGEDYRPEAGPVCPSTRFQCLKSKPYSICFCINLQI